MQKQPKTGVFELFWNFRKKKVFFKNFGDEEEIFFEFKLPLYILCPSLLINFQPVRLKNGWEKLWLYTQTNFFKLVNWGAVQLVDKKNFSFHSNFFEIQIPLKFSYNICIFSI